MQIFREEDRENILYFIPLLSMVSAAVVCDFRSWRIPNSLIAVGLILGFAVSAWHPELSGGLAGSLAGCVIPVAALYVLFLIRALGAGDIKLFSVIGTFVGTDVTRVMICSFLAGGVLSVIYLSGKICKMAANRSRLSKKELFPGFGKSGIHFSAAVFAGTAIYILTEIC